MSKNSKKTVISSRKLHHIFEIPIDSTSKNGVLNKITSSLNKFDSQVGKKPFLVVTPNPEIILKALENPALKKVLINADISLPDGIGIAAADKFLNLPNTKMRLTRPLYLLGQGLAVGYAVIFNTRWLTGNLAIIKGRELFADLIVKANDNNWRVFLLGMGAPSAAKIAGQTYPGLRLKFDSGPIVDESGQPVNRQQSLLEREVINKINEFEPHLLFVGFGAPKQECWLGRQLGGLKVGGAMCVGSSFDTYSGLYKRPPVRLSASLEWLWRLVSGSNKPSRVFRAFPIFPLKVFWQKLRQ